MIDVENHKTEIECYTGRMIARENCDEMRKGNLEKSHMHMCILPLGHSSTYLFDTTLP